MAWRIDGIGKTYRQAAEEAAGRVGLPLGQWLDRVIRDHPAGPTRDDADSEITQALAALETSIEQSNTRLSRIIAPLRDQVVRLETESEQALHHDHAVQGRSEREITRRIDRLEAHDRQAGPDDAQPEGPRNDRGKDGGKDGGRDGGKEALGTLPPLTVIKRQRMMRLIGGIGAMVMLVVLSAIWVWLWSDLGQPPNGTPLAQSEPVVTPSADQTPPAVIGEAALPGTSPATPLSTKEISTLRLRAQAQGADAADAAYRLGMALLQGRGVPANIREGGEWIANAALTGHGQAQLQLGRLYMGGIGYTRDPRQAFFWIQSAAEQGITEAEHALGMAYNQGNGVARNHTLAARWFRKAAAKKYAPSLYQLGLIYELGLDFRADKKRALDWYRKAAASGSAAAAVKAQSLETAGVTAPPTTTTATATATASVPAVQPAAAPARTRLSTGEIAEIQRLLKSLDFDPGPADGKPGAKTSEAIRLYQTMAGLPADGRASRTLLDQIREVAGAPARPAP